MREALLFAAAGTWYLSPLGGLDEVLMPVQLDVVAGAPAFLRGVMDLRGELLPVVALAERVGAGDPEPWRRSSRILKVSTQGLDYGVIVDAVGRVLDLDEATQQPLLAETDGRRFSGPLWRIDQRLVQEIRLDALLDDEALARLQPVPPRLTR